MNHVASLVTAAPEGREADVVIAALLHVAVEEQGVAIELITSEYGQKVAGIVME